LTLELVSAMLLAGERIGIRWMRIMENHLPAGIEAK